MSARCRRKKSDATAATRACIIQKLAPGDSIKALDNSVCVVTNFADGHREELRGPAEVNVRDASLVVVGGSPNAVQVKPLETAYARSDKKVGMEHVGGEVARKGMLGLSPLFAAQTLRLVCNLTLTVELQALPVRIPVSAE